MIYSYAEDNIYCGLYIGSQTEVPMAGGKVTLKQQTDYPFDGKITISVSPEAEGEEFTLWLRVPTWSGEKFVPGELYDYADETNHKVVARVNGSKVRAEIVNGFIPVRREWKSGDEVTLDIPMPVRYNVADERVEADRGKVSITRGPLVYCAEEPDNAQQVSSVVINEIGAQGEVKPFAEGVLKGIPAISLSAKDGALTLIPYYAWNNRGDGTAMNVWFKLDNVK